MLNRNNIDITVALFIFIFLNNHGPLLNATIYGDFEEFRHCLYVTVFEEFSDVLLKAPAVLASTLPLSKSPERPFCFETAVRQTSERWV